MDEMVLVLFFIYLILFSNNCSNKSGKSTPFFISLISHDNPQANFLHYIISYAVSVTVLCIYRVGTAIVNLQVTMPELQLVLKIKSIEFISSY